MRNRDAVREYVTGSLWVLPGISAVLALVAGFILSRIPLGPESPLAFRGTADDARTLLSNVTSTVVTVIALVLGLTVVALQLSSTQFSPRLLRSFLRDRPTQVVLSTFVATFAYSAAGLYTVGLSAGGHTEEFPRLAVSGALVLLFASLAMVVYFADHLAHSIQIDAIGKRVELDTLAVVNGRLGSVEDVEFTPPEWAVPLLAPVSGYVQSAYPELLLPLARQHRVHVRLGVWVGDHIVSGTVLAWMWTAARDEPVPDPVIFQRALMQRGAGRVRAHVATGRRARYPATRRHGLQGTVPGSERSLHRGPGDRPSLGDLLRPRGSPARRRRGRGPDR